jgi:ribulose-5-phosphate 4-epimerase/fuculose-1-phosphate aldolase
MHEQQHGPAVLHSPLLALEEIRMNAPMELKSAPKIDCSPEEWEARVDLACAYRAVSAMGWHNSLIYNHISTRVPGKEPHFLINPFGLMYHEITASNLLKIDLDGNKLVPSPHPVLMAGFVVHRSVHMSREDAKCVIHTHSKAGVAVACQEQGLLPITLGAMNLSNKLAYYDVEGATLDADESERIAKALGNKDVMILRNHGLLTVGPSMGHAFNLMRRLESACESQVLAQAGGAKLTMPPAHVVEKTANQSTKLVDKGAAQTDGPGILWAAVRRWMTQIDPSYMD